MINKFDTYNDPNIRVFSDEFNVIDARAESHNILIYSQGNDECYTIMAANMPFLYTVEHDDTLLGTGRQGSPLSISPEFFHPTLVWSVSWAYADFRIYRLGDFVLYKYKLNKEASVDYKESGENYDDTIDPYGKASSVAYGGVCEGGNTYDRPNASKLVGTISSNYRPNRRIYLPLATVGVQPSYQQRGGGDAWDCWDSLNNYANNMRIETNGDVRFGHGLPYNYTAEHVCDPSEQVAMGRWYYKWSEGGWGAVVILSSELSNN